MGRIYEEKMDLFLLSLLNQGFKGLCFEAFLRFDVSSGRNLLHLAARNPVFFRNSRTWGRDRFSSVTVWILAWASL